MNESPTPSQIPFKHPQPPAKQPQASPKQSQGPSGEFPVEGLEPPLSPPYHQDADAKGISDAAAEARVGFEVDAGPNGAADGKRHFFEEALTELMGRRRELQGDILELERRRQQIQKEITASFSGQSDAIARRLKGFQEYLVGALQDLAVTAEQIELIPQPVVVQPSPLDQETASVPSTEASAPATDAGPFAADGDLIRNQLQLFQGQPDFFADPWKLRRTLEASSASLLESWFMEQGGRGAQPSAGSRNRNALLAAASIAILGELYGDRFQTLVLAGQPERMGEWRRGLQDCLGLSREDFGPSSGIVLFERSDALIERADRLEERGELPFIVIDAAERVIEIPILQFPLWLAFAGGPDEITMEEAFY